ncbi:MAG: ATPase, T2SS/T4P/T4SS family [Pseudomonadota bacterium]
MAVTSDRIHLGGLARKLVLDGLLEEDAAAQASQSAQEEGVPFVTYVIANKLGAAREIAQAAAEEFGTPLVDIAALEIDVDVVKLVNEKMIRQHHALPLYKRGNRLFVGVADPTNLSALEEIRFATGTTVEAIVCEEDKLSATIDKTLEAADSSMSDMVGDDDLEDLDDLEVAEESDPNDDGGASDVDDAPVVRFVNKILVDAIKKGVSDIHIEPYEKFCRVRYRIDGVLTEVARPPLQLAMKISSRIKVMARLDVSERRVPQDGRIKLKLSKTKAIDFRVSTCPTLFGEKSVLRILDPHSMLVVHV